MNKVPERCLIELFRVFFMIDSIVLPNVFIDVYLEIWPFYKYLSLQFSSFLSKVVVAMHQLLFYSFLNQLDSCSSPQVS